MCTITDVQGKLVEQYKVPYGATLEVIKNNREFVTFRIEEYASWKNDSWVQGFVIKTKYGTAKEIANVFEATILKDWQLLQIAERNSVVGTINRFLIKHKNDIENFSIINTIQTFLSKNSSIPIYHNNNN